MIYLIITLIIGLTGGLTAMRFKIPAGAMIGAMVSVALFNIVTGDAFMPYEVRILTQIAAGALVGTRIRRKDIYDLRYMVKPAVLMIFCMIVLDLSMGYLMYRVTEINLVTSLFACTPGGILDTSLISSDLGAESSKVAILHLIRLMSVMILFPTLMKFISGRLNASKNVKNSEQTDYIDSSHNEFQKVNATTEPEYSIKEKCLNLTLTITVAFAAGLLGYKLKIPAGTITFAMIAVGILNVFSNKGYIPVKMTRVTQICAGTLIGEMMTYSDLIALKGVILPAFILLIGIIIINLLIGFLISKISGFELITSLLASAPGGLSDIALIAKDLGADVPKVAILQLTRHVCVIVIFPIVIKYLCS